MSHAETLTEIPRHTVQVFTEVIRYFFFFFGVSWDHRKGAPSFLNKIKDLRQPEFSL